jgi:cysteinyl-tRNA synthetase
MTGLRLYDSQRRAKQAFVPLVEGRVGVYLCGPTVYDLPHIGNARSAVVFDVLHRVLRHLFPVVTFVRNITDVDDKILEAAARTGESIASLTGRTERAYLDDMAALGVLPPTAGPRVTDHIPQIVAMIQRLIERAHAYVAEGHVLFHVPSMADYGALSGRSTEDMIAGARIDVAPYKRHPADFTLWKPSPDGKVGWPSPWGLGRPGWHIECSAMIEATLGLTIDIHGGGNDLIFPHHENERAQSICALGTPFVRYWLHNGMLTVDGEKMSKSLGNFLTAREVLAEAPPEAVRLFLISGHYRQPLDWSRAALASARTALDRFYLTLRRNADIDTDPDATPPPEVLDPLLDDLNTPEALAALHGLAGRLNKAEDAEGRRRLKTDLLAGARLLGLLGGAPESWLAGAANAEGPDAEHVARRIADRLTARAARDFALADAIRAELAADGIQLDDGPAGTTWRRVAQSTGD